MTAPAPEREKGVDLVAIKSAEMVTASIRTYREHAEKAAMRCALGDAAGLCDVIARSITEAGRGRNGRVSQAVKDAAKIAKRCGDDIWAMRELIVLP